MKSNFVSLMSLCISIAALFIVSFPTLPRTLGFDYMGIIFTALASLVAILLIAQIVNYTTTQDRIKELASEEARHLASDFRTAMNGLTIYLSQCVLFDGTSLTASFHKAMLALQEAMNCRDKNIRAVAVEHILAFASNIIAVSSEKRQCKIQPGMRKKYIELIESSGNKDIERLLEFLKAASYEDKELNVFDTESPNFFSVRIEGESIRLEVVNADQNRKRK